MSLRDAIRDAVDERNKQSGGDAVLATPDEVEDEKSEVAPVESIATQTPQPKAVKVRTAKSTGKPASTPERVQNPATEIVQPPKQHTANHKAVNTASSKAVQSEETKEDELENIKTAALTVRVPRNHRIHWLISAKKEGTSLTAAITEALNARFGEPND